MDSNLMTDGVISLDDRPALEAVKRANTGLDDHEKKTKTVLDRTGREWQVYGDGLVRVTDKSKTSLTGCYSRWNVKPLSPARPGRIG